ncbi:hypothetical protein Syn7502_02862 [Synechococcus sp. PCC 7502]|uniref:hypothetical protein n=1 Tax=Synechococcus sp. PCC 7502 TaxID=1173263 RepID=UPI00029FF22B|nr:hypothetical protein [Synechococcus sp. PCC 7502]AFY74798.1 hypothetical protein Syn7502_02862 [Synechococcus sp. PCC 7502]
MTKSQRFFYLSFPLERAIPMQLPNCPKCGINELKVETPDNHGVIADFSYWQCQACGWFSPIYYYPHEQPELED